MLIPVKVCNNIGVCKASDVLAGLNYCLEYAKEYSIAIISGSFGDRREYTENDCPAYFGNTFVVIDGANINSVFAAGNDGYRNGINYPACDPAIISVSASTKEDEITSFSNLGTNLDLLAPGLNINSTIVDGYGLMSGTSMAAPHVAGVIALIREVNGTINPQSIKETLKSTGKMVSGYSRVDAEKAIKSLIEVEVELPQVNASNDETIPDFTILAVPTHSKPILNTTFGTNTTLENLTVYNQSTFDSDGDSVTNIINWYENGKSITVLNMPFDTNSSSVVKDYSPYENNGGFYGSMRAEFDMNGSANSYRYEDMTSVADYQIQAGDFLEYDVYWSNSNGYISFDYTASDGTALRGAGFTDQNGIDAHPAANLNTYALNKWYHRKINISAHQGKTISYYDIASENDSDVTVLAFLDNIKITDGTSATRKVVFSGENFTYSPHLVNAGAVISLNNQGNVTKSWTNLGINGGAYDFDGVNDHIILTKQPDLSEGFTFSAWVKRKGDTPIVQEIFNNNQFFLRAQPEPENSSNPFEAFVKLSDSSIEPRVGSGVAAIVGQWFFVTVTWNKNLLKIYVNGDLTGTSTRNGSLTSAVEAHIGNSEQTILNGYHFNGTIDEVRIYDNVLSAEQIKVDYNAGFPKYNKIVSQETSVGEVWHAELTPNDKVGDGVAKMSNGVQIGNSPTQDSPILNLVDNSLVVYPQNVQDIDGDAIIANITNWYYDGSSLTVLNMPFEALTGVHSIAPEKVGAWYFEKNYKDFSGQGNDGICINCPTYTLSGKVGGVYGFDGVNDYIEIPNEANFDFERTNSFSACSWIRLKTVTPTSQTIISKLDGSAPYPGWEFNAYDGSGASDGLQVYLLNHFANNNYISVYADNILSPNNWYHACFTYNGSVTASGVKIYLNGVKQTTTVAKDNLSASILNNKPVQIGIRDVSSIPLNGVIDEVYIFNYSLDASEIDLLYKKSFDREKDVFDYSPYSNHGINNGSSWISSGKLGGAYDFDGVNDCMIVPNAPTLHFEGNFTLESWVKLDSLSGKQYVLEKGRTPINYELYYSGGRFTFHAVNDVIPQELWLNSTTNVQVNQWYYLAVTYNQSEASFYVNGTKEANSTPIDLMQLSSDLAIGCNEWDGNYSSFINGLLDEVRIYNKSLSASQILLNYNSGSPRYDIISNTELYEGAVWSVNVTPNDGYFDGLTKGSATISKTTYNLIYDANGNLIQGKNKYYEYNTFNQLIRVRSPDSTGTILEEYAYDPNGKRIRKIKYLTAGGNETTYYLGENFVRKVNSSGTYDTTYYHHNGQLIAKNESGTIYFFHPDNLGSTTLITDLAGNTVEETFYYPFGLTLTGGTTEERLYTGKEKDSTDIYYYGARYYDPDMGLFTQPDPVIADVYNPQQLNKYSYVLNNPYTYIDPDGKFVIILPMVYGAGFILSAAATLVSTTITTIDYHKGDLTFGQYLTRMAINVLTAGYTLPTKNTLMQVIGYTGSGSSILIDQIIESLPPESTSSISITSDILIPETLNTRMLDTTPTSISGDGEYGYDPLTEAYIQRLVSKQFKSELVKEEFRRRYREVYR